MVPVALATALSSTTEGISIMPSSPCIIIPQFSSKFLGVMPRRYKSECALCGCLNELVPWLHLTVSQNKGSILEVFQGKDP